MNANESEYLSRFLNRLREARIGDRDPEAEQMIRKTVEANPDAAYLLVQRALLMEEALNNAKAQIAQLRQQTDRGTQGRPEGFPGRSNPWAAGLDSAQNSTRTPAYAGYPAPQGSTSGGGSSLLGNIASTAAGVVAGSFLFQGIESLLGHRAAPSAFVPPADSLMGDTIVNNYYGSDDTGDWEEQQRADPFLAAENDDTFGGEGFLDGSDDSNWI